MSANRMKNEWKYNESLRTTPGAFITSNTILKDRDKPRSVFGTEAYRSIEFSVDHHALRACFYFYRTQITAI